jgi:hypothetical protein
MRRPSGDAKYGVPLGKVRYLADEAWAPEAGTIDCGALTALNRHVGDNFKVAVGHNSASSQTICATSPSMTRRCASMSSASSRSRRGGIAGIITSSFHRNRIHKEN